MVNNALEFIEYLIERTLDIDYIKNELKKSIHADYRRKKNNDPYSSNKIINVGTDCNMFYSEGEREDEK